MRSEVSVCMATYNGSKYICEQISSILFQLNDFDELIIVDDSSTDDTLRKIKTFNDKRIKIYKNLQNKGHVYSFELALHLARKKIIILSDQDDIWLSDKVNQLVESLEKSNKYLITSNFKIFKNDDLENFIKMRYVLKEKDSNKNVKNIINIILGRSSYFGSSMALNKNLLKLVLPFPKFIESHDIWIAFAANISNSNWHLEKPTLMRRLHENNLTPNTNRSLIKVVNSRINYLICIITLIYRISILNLFKKNNE